MSTDITTLPPSAAPGELMINARRLEIVAHNRKLIKDFINSALKPDHDYGTIEGCGDRQVLFQPGIQKIMSLANVYCDPVIETKELGNGHREYVVKTVLKQLGSDMPVSTGMGSCSTMESKYRYRNAEPVDTNQPLPRGYWDAPKDKRRALLPPGTTAKKNESGKWTIHKFTGDKVENADLADQYNTCLKMAVKRSNMNAVQNMMGGWGEQFLAEDDVPEQPPVDATVIEPLADVDREKMREDYRSWPQNKKEAYDRRLAELIDTGTVEDDAIVQAYTHITSYFR